MAGQYVTAATKVAIVGWLFRELAGRLACTDRSLQGLLHSLLTSCLLGCRGSWRWTLLSVGGVLLLSGMVLSVAFVCLGCGDGEQTYPGLWFLPVWHGGIPDSLLFVGCVVCAA